MCTVESMRGKFIATNAAKMKNKFSDVNFRIVGNQVSTRGDSCGLWLILLNFIEVCEFQ